ncbi:MAG: NAD-dependent epimerase/dehydratase family protein [Sandaracinaceae bacterium]|nr:NAD-dependent epimerase/dehydratase family protein [Sandaracinaceae bacterium]
MRALVTGGNGFVGRHLVRALAARGDEVVTMDLTEWAGGDALDPIGRRGPARRGRARERVRGRRRRVPRRLARADAQDRRRGGLRRERRRHSEAPVRVPRPRRLALRLRLERQRGLRRRGRRRRRRDAALPGALPRALRRGEGARRGGGPPRERRSARDLRDPSAHHLRPGRHALLPRRPLARAERAPQGLRRRPEQAQRLHLRRQPRRRPAHRGRRALAPERARRAGLLRHQRRAPRLLGAGGPPARRPRAAAPHLPRALPDRLRRGRARETLDAMRGIATSEESLTRFTIRYLTTHHYFSCAKAERDFGYRPRVGLDEGIARTIAALRAGEPSA